MKDYLSNLSARSFHRMDGIPWVSPRVPFLFEPPQAAPGTFAPDAPRASRNSRSGDGRTPSLLRMSGEDSEPEEIFQQTPEDMRRTSAAVSPINVRRARHFKRVDPGTAGKVSGHEESAVEVPRQEEPAATRTQTDGESGRRTRSGAMTRPFSVHARGEEGPMPLLNGPDEDIRREGRRMPMEASREIAVRPVSPEAATQRPDKVIAPVIAQASPPSGEAIRRAWTAARFGEDNGKPAPTIQVTIGRIEVRASPPPAGSRSKSPQREPMSLDQYLRIRNGGGR